ncbi:MAG: type II toxin-antitoxin system HicB family antitoxin [Candidatus Micrarchaeota archaeon]
MQKSKIKEYEVVIEQDENKVYVAYVPELPGCHTEGDTINEVVENIKEAMDLYLEYTQSKVENPMKFIEVRKVAVPVASIS